VISLDDNKLAVNSRARRMLRASIVSLICVCGIHHCATAADIETEHTKKRPEDLFFEKYKKKFMAINNMNLVECRETILQPFPEDVPLHKFLSDPRYDLAYDTFNLFDGTYRFMGDTDKIPESLQADYWFRGGAFVRLAEKDKKFVTKYLLDRKDTMPPTVWDGMLATGRLLNPFMGDSSLRSSEGKAMWQQLANAKNPAYRILAVQYSRSWADMAEMKLLWAAALSDEYWYIRSLALDYLIQKKLPGTKEILEQFLKRKIDPKLSAEFLALEEQLNETAQTTLDELRGEQNSPEPPNK